MDRTSSEEQAGHMEMASSNGTRPLCQLQTKRTQGLTTAQSRRPPAGVESQEDMGSVPRKHHFDYSKSLETLLLSGKNEGWGNGRCIL